jgi:3-oxoacyl-[acyl-carrier-protein] synthase-3
VLFGDGAGAVVLEASIEPGILATSLHADGRYGSILAVPGQITGGLPTGDPFVRMDGQAVFKFAVKVLAEVAAETIAATGMANDDIDWLVPHQANIRIIQSTVRKLGLTMDRCMLTLASHGNTSAASIPLAFDEGVRSGRIRTGQNVLFEGVGGGFAWGAMLLKY